MFLIPCNKIFQHFFFLKLFAKHSRQQKTLDFSSNSRKMFSWEVRIEIHHPETLLFIPKSKFFLQQLINSNNSFIGIELQVDYLSGSTSRHASFASEVKAKAKKFSFFA
jgi:hypothetical protein